MSFFQQLNLVAEETEAHLADVLKRRGENANAKLNEAIEYSALGGGKRLRAYMVAEFFALCGGTGENWKDYAAAIEMVHAFSLIHDDLPAMDNDDMRRGKPSNHKAFGEATAILAGDSLALDAFGVICESYFCSPHQNGQAVIALAKYAGGAGMCAGQQFDLDGEGKRINVEQLTRLVDLKTGALFSCACALGCIAASGSEAQKAAAKEFGLYVGRAFQITDDLLDIYSTPEELGKTVGKDIESEKSTFPSLLGEEEAKRYASECISKAIAQLDAFDNGEARKRLADFCEYILIRRK